MTANAANSARSLQSFDLPFALEGYLVYGKTTGKRGDMEISRLVQIVYTPISGLLTEGETYESTNSPCHKRLEREGDPLS